MLKYFYRLLYALIAGVIFFWSGFFFVVYILFPDITNEKDFVTVPNIIGKKLETAQNEISAKGLNLVLSDTLPSMKFNSKIVIEQDYKNKYMRYKGDTVKAVLSERKSVTFVPNLNRVRFNDAVDKLNELGLIIGNQVYVFSTDYKKNQIIANHPIQNSIIKRGESVDLLISKGPFESDFEINDFTGKRVSDVLFAVNKEEIPFEFYKLNEDSLETKISSIPYNEFIIKQEPLEGSFINPFFNKIKLYIKDNS